MDSDTLTTASTYLNNLLLARGLLKNGKNLDFAKPTRDTRAQIINLVHDLLLRRDRDQESRENVAQTFRTLRSEQTRKDAELDRLRTRTLEKDRVLGQAQVETRNAKAELKKLETSTKGLHDQIAKLKTTISQVKAQCINDIKKRDLQIEKLKTHLQGQQRGNKSTVVAPSISISGGSGGSRSTTSMKASVRELHDPEYSLTQETNEFLTQLSQNLSDENDILIVMVRRTLFDLRQLLGLSEQDNDNTMNQSNTYMVDPTQVSYEKLVADLDMTMETLKSLLTNPNFVSVEEVDVRDEEINRLREGWEMMETRWKEVLLMMDGWRRRMEKTGDTINLDDLKRGLGLGVGLEDMRNAASPMRNRRLSRHTLVQQVDDLSEDEDSSNRDSGVSDMHDDGIARTKQSRQSPTKGSTIDPPDFFDLRPVRGQKLRQLSNNFQSPRRVAFAEMVEDKSPITHEHEVEESSHEQEPEVPSPSAVQAEGKEHSGMFGLDGARSPRPISKNRKRHSSPHALPAEPLAKYRLRSGDEMGSSSFVEDDPPKLSMEDKLRVAQAEAEEARSKTAPLKEVEDEELDLEFGDEIGKLRSPAKKSKIKGRPRRRKSTLSPEELESLLGLE